MKDEEIRRRFEIDAFSQPRDSKRPAERAIAEALFNAAREINRQIPDCHGKNMAILKLQEAMHWTEAIFVNPGSRLAGSDESEGQRRMREHREAFDRARATGLASMAAATAQLTARRDRFAKRGPTVDPNAPAKKASPADGRSSVKLTGIHMPFESSDREEED
jgi:hypothetical protein